MPEGFITSLTLSEGLDSLSLWPSAGGMWLVDVDFGFPAIRENVVDRVGVSGTRDFTETYGASVVSLVLQAVPTDGVSVQTHVDAVRAFMHPRKRPTITWEPVGAPERFYSVRPGNAANALNMRSLRGGTVQLQLQFKAPDGRAFSTDITSVVLEPNTGAGGGRTYPLVYPRDYEYVPPDGNFTDGGGNTETFPTVVIEGPVANPVVTNGDYGAVGFADYSILQDETITLDFNEKTAVKNDGTNLRGELTYRDWWAVQPGENEFRFDTEVFSTTTLATISWRAAYL